MQNSNGQTPFGFAFGKRDQVFVSEAFGGAPDASATSSYELDQDGLLTTISASVGTNQTANCWVVVTPNGRFAYVTNTGSGSISGYRIAFDGTIALLDADGRTGVTGGGPIDLALTDNGRFLYSLNTGTNTIGAFRVRADGSLSALPFTAGLPVGATVWRLAECCRTRLPPLRLGAGPSEDGYRSCRWRTLLGGHAQGDDGPRI